MTSWGKLTEQLAAPGQEATESERRLSQQSLDAALDAVLSEGRSASPRILARDDREPAPHARPPQAS